MNRDSLQIFILIFSLLLSVVSLITGFNYQLNICGEYAYTCSDSLSQIAIYTVVFLPIFIFSAITYRMDLVKKSWRIFSFFWASLTLTVIYSIVSEAGGSFGSLHGGYENMVVIGLFVVYPVISALIILYYYLRLGKKKDSGDHK